MKVIAPYLPRPSTARDSGTGRLPDALVVGQVRRLAVLAAVGVGLWLFGLLVEALLVPAVRENSGVAMAIEAVAIVVSILMFVYVRYAPHAPATKIDVGLAYMILNAAAVAFIDTWVYSPAEASTNQLSWNTLVILVASMILPAPPRRMLAACLVAASTDPLGVWLAHLNGHPTAGFWFTVVVYLPNYVCAGLALLPGHVLRIVGRQLKEAQELGSYRLLEPLGKGGMGEVWRAEHRLLARPAAIKLVRPEVLGAANASEAHVIQRRFEREARATAVLSSPHTIDLFDYGVTEEGTFYYVMELLRGRDLESLVREFGPVRADRAIYLLRQVCHSLADAHARGLVHRDIKPANVYVCRMGLEYDFVKVLDFGLVKFRNVAESTTLTLQTVGQPATGTPAYMAPEIVLGESDVDRRADVYALGCVAYFLLTGQLVFDAETPMKMLIQHVQAEPVPPSRRTELPIPPDLDDIVLACLAKDPAKRPQDAEQLFDMACRCTATGAWSQEQARIWWETYLPELTGPLTLSAPDADRSGAVILA